MKKKKVLFSILIIVVLGVILFFYNTFNGNPISKHYATKALENYLEEHYPDKKLRLSEGHFNFKFESYDFTVSEIQKNAHLGEYEFSVRRLYHPTVHWDGIYYANLDEPLMERLGQEAGEEITNLLSQEFDNIVSAGASCEVLKGKLAADVTWQKDLPLDKPMSIFIQLNSTGQSKKDFYEQAKQIQTLFNEQGYTYDSVNINGDLVSKKSDLKDWYVKYALYFHQSEEIKKSDVN